MKFRWLLLLGGAILLRRAWVGPWAPLYPEVRRPEHPRLPTSEPGRYYVR